MRGTYKSVRLVITSIDISEATVKYFNKGKHYYIDGKTGKVLAACSEPTSSVESEVKRRSNTALYNRAVSKSRTIAPIKTHIRPTYRKESLCGSTRQVFAQDEEDEGRVDDFTDPNSYPSLLCVRLEVLCYIPANAERDTKKK